jgi:hypothetical protein
MSDWSARSCQSGSVGSTWAAVKPLTLRMYIVPNLTIYISKSQGYRKHLVIYNTSLLQVGHQEKFLKIHNG